jgi:hypothetical protein
MGAAAEDSPRARRDYSGMRENAGVLETHNSHVTVRLVAWGVIDQAEFEA